MRNTPLLNGSRYKKNPDNIVNKHGKMIKNITKACDVYILNNLVIGNKEFDGKFTYTKGGRRSQNDQCLSNISGLENIKSFSIHDLDFNFSDHCPISVCVDLRVQDNFLAKTVSADLLSQPGEKLQKRATQLQNKDINWVAFKNSAIINLSTVANEMNYDVGTQDSLDKALNKVEDCLYNTAIQCRFPRVNIAETIPHTLTGLIFARINFRGTKMFSFRAD